MFHLYAYHREELAMLLSQTSLPTCTFDPISSDLLQNIATEILFYSKHHFCTIYWIILDSMQHDVMSSIIKLKLSHYPTSLPNADPLPCSSLQQNSSKWLSLLPLVSCLQFSLRAITSRYLLPPFQ